ncbi:MAG: hypothetical protein OXF74_05405 [Rhodobacteraceae bacterium]|nr:hypothetical protein [Paracoccaceae bacterium]
MIPAADWTDEWLTRPLPPEARSCSGFAGEVLRVTFGLDIRLPDPMRGVRRSDGQIRRLSGDFARRTRKPEAGDGVLMECLGARALHGYHIGIHAGGGCVLHWMAGTGAVLHPIADLPSVGLQLEGFYRWI